MMIRADDTMDIIIPSSFVSRASYLSLIKTWGDQEGQAGEEKGGLLIIMSKEEVFAWFAIVSSTPPRALTTHPTRPLLDLLPSLLTLLTVLTQ
jgi:hypothetical protein